MPTDRDRAGSPNAGPRKAGPRKARARETRPSARRRFAVATDEPVLERWQAASVSALVQAGVAIVAWINPAERQAGPSAGAFALEVARPEDMPAGLPRPARLGQGLLLPQDVDVLLDLTRAGVKPDARDGATETWAFAYGREGLSDPVSVAMRAIVRGAGPIRVALKTSSGGHVLRTGAVRTTPGSLTTQLDRLLLEPAAWPAQVAMERVAAPDGAAPNELAGDGAGPSRAVGAAGVDRRGQVTPIPVPLLRVAVAARQALTSAEALLRHSEWTIGIVRRPIADWLDTEAVPEVSWLPRRPGRYAADPFGVERDGRTHVLFEDFDHRQGRGVISATSVDAAGAWAEPEVVLDTGSHASYPHLLEADGETWMIPETSDLGELRLYRATSFPLAWSLEARLMADVHISDATVLRHDDRWWLFGTSRGRGVDEALRVWHAPALTGPWRLHALDPVKIDVTSARPGGTPFLRDGALYRPAQDCANRYGARLTINRVDVIDERRFAEVAVRTIDPIPAFPDGLHTLAAAGSGTLIDGNRMRFVPDAVRWQIAARLGR